MTSRSPSHPQDGPYRTLTLHRMFHARARAVARIEATELGLDIRFVVTSLEVGAARPSGSMTASIARAAKPRIRSSCTRRNSPLTAPPADRRQPCSPRAPHRRLLADAHGARGHSQSPRAGTAEFAMLRLHLLKIAAGVVETATRIRLAFAAACPEADLIRGLPGALLPLGP